MDQLQLLLGEILKDGGPALVVSGLLSARLTKFDGWKMVVQTGVVGVLLLFVYSLLGWTAIPLSDVWHWLMAGAANGTLSMFLYKTGIFNSVLTLLKARTDHQLAQATKPTA